MYIRVEGGVASISHLDGQSLRGEGMVMDAQCNLLAGRDTQDPIDKEFHESMSAHGYRPRDKWSHEQFVSDTCDCRGAVVLDQSTFPVAELLFAAMDECEHRHLLTCNQHPFTNHVLAVVMQMMIKRSCCSVSSTAHSTA